MSRVADGPHQKVTNRFRSILAIWDENEGSSDWVRIVKVLLHT